MKWMHCLVFILGAQLFGFVNPSQIYPPVIQQLVDIGRCNGDRYGQFRGDPIAVLSDQSVWKIHPDSARQFALWKRGDVICVSERVDRYWFKREHKLLLCNKTTGSTAKAMLFRHSPSSLQIVNTQNYFKSTRPKYIEEISYEEDDEGKQKKKVKQIFVGYEECDPRKIVTLSDGSVWVIKHHLQELQMGMRVYVGAQGIPQRFYDFILITGDEREAVVTLARPQK